MKDQPDDKLRRAVEELSARAARLREQYRERGLGEENTKASLIEPMLEALGWAIRDPDEVYREFRPNPRDSPVDYCLRLMRETRLLIEAKGLGEVLGDRKWVKQILGYATMAGAEWCVLTDGEEYRLYNAIAPVEADDKLFRQVRLGDDDRDTTVAVLALLSRGNMEGNLLNVLWNAHHVDRRVKQVMRSLVEGPDRKLVNLVRRWVPDLAPKAIAESINRLDIRIEAPEAPAPPVQGFGGPSPSGKARKQRRIKGRTSPKPPGGVRVTLSDVIGASLLSPPVRLFRRYKGRDLEAQLHPDGKVEFGGTVYDSGSTAAEYARGTVTGRRMNTNGWTFWQYTGEDGKPHQLDEQRQHLIRMKTAGGAAGSPDTLTEPPGGA